MPDSIDDLFNIRAGRYFIAQATGICARCERPSRVLAVGLPPGHEVLELADEGPDDDDPDDDGSSDESRGDVGVGDTWAMANHAALLFHVAQLSQGVRSQMCAMSQAYRKSTDEPAVDSCWANHCAHCGTPFDDQDLFCEPGGAFFPVSEADAGRIQLLTIEEPMAADAAGYAQDPDFLDSMRRT